MGDFRNVNVSCCVLCATAFFVCCLQADVMAASERFVGSKACSECHETEYARYTEFSKKAHSGKSVQIMAPDLTVDELKECYACHATGYGRPGGFVSFEETPEMGNAGCEVCHGPGYAHVESGGDPELIKREIKVSDCEVCHNSERVAAFDYKPLLFGGAH